MTKKSWPATKHPATVGIVLLLCGASCCASAADFVRPRFGFVAHAPDDWKVFGERERPGQMLLDFGLPKIWSEVEKQDIENSVFILARRDARSLEDLISDEDERVANIRLSKEAVPVKTGKAFVVVTKTDGLEYKTLSTYRFENGVGYVIGFTATQGTFERNLPKYQAFVEKLEFVAPEAVAGN